MNEKQIQEDWLELQHGAENKLDTVINELTSIINNISYVLPHIADDLRFTLKDAKLSRELFAKSTSASMTERLNHNKSAINNMLSTLLHKQ